MNRVYFLLITALFIVGCNTGKSDHKASLDELIQQRDELNELIATMEKDLAENDSTDQKIIKNVTADTASIYNFEHYIEIQGNAESDKTVNVTTDMGGLVTKVYVEEGQFVSAGQTLMQLDNSIIQSSINEVKTQLDLATTVYERQKALWEKNIGSEIQYIQAKTNKEALERKLATTQTQLAKTRVTAPFSGTVEDIMVKSGEMASPGFPLAKVVNVDQIKVEAAVPESYIAAINKNSKAKVFFPVLDKEVDAKIKSIGQFINGQNRTFNVIVSVNNAGKEVKPNMLANVRLKDYSNPKALVIPGNLIQQLHGEDFVYLIKTDSTDKKQYIHKAYVKTGNTYLGLTEINEGLNVGDLVVKDGYRDVTEGDEVSVSVDEVMTEE